ncbi:MAG: fumarylacetoacetate hydrolase family protein [Candidatus Altiarchaeota archaeon]|nr:fumarylacetoacetate hydrolase family protein [Candidatus Altiarchaeota archaeon]
MRECILNGFDTSGKKKLEGSVKLLAPVMPSKIVGLGWNYAAHNRELKCADDKQIVFLKPASSVIGPEENIILPEISKQVEHEVELGVVVARDCRNVAVEDAPGCIAGYTIALDITARDLQWKAREKGGPWDICKGMDSFAPIGPWIITRKEVPDPHKLGISLKVNGEIRQKSNTRDMIHSVEEALSYVSGFFTLKTGDVIATGTPEGVGPLKDGDLVEAEIESIGCLRNHAAAERP